MTRYIIIKTFLITVICILSANRVPAQDGNGIKFTYLNFNESDKTFVNDVTNEVLSIQYTDVYARKKDLLLNIYNWSNVLVAQVALQKELGVNYYNLKLTETIGGLVKNQVYTCKAIDENGKLYQLQFRVKDLPQKDIEVDIFVNPTFVKCTDPTGNLVEFYGNVQGGKAPYTVNWYILNNTRTGFLYQPREQLIERPGTTSVVQVDQSPAYYVILNVQDACGNEKHQVVQVQCQDGKKKINTVFFETLQDFSEMKGKQ
jgi:hypothetical protein